MPTKRILIFNDCFCMGGTEILLVNLLNHLAEKEPACKTILLLPYPSDKDILLNRVSDQIQVKYIFPEEPKGIKAWLLKNIMIFYPRLFAKIIGFSATDYDEIVCFKDGFYSIFFSRIRLGKYLWIHNQPYQRDYKSNSLKEWLSFKLNRLQINRMAKSFERYDRIICVSESTKKGYIEVYRKGKDGKNIEILYNALNLSGILKRAEEPIGATRSERTHFVVVIRLSHEKTVDRAIYATRKLRDEGYDFDMDILGNGAEYNNLRQLITEQGMDEYIKMHGQVENPYPYMKAADWFLCPSSRESFALTLLEAITIGTPVITTACGGPDDVIDRGRYGIFVDNSFEGVYEGMKKALDSPELRLHYLERKDECLTRFDYKKWLTAVDDLLEV